MNISARQFQLLNYIISEYIKTAKPVGSLAIANCGAFNLSSATIRNDMNELEENGLLAQLHTSGGRVPTDLAYRYFVNNIVENYDLVPKIKEKHKIDNAIQKSNNDGHEINKNIAKTLAELSNSLVIANMQADGNFFKVGLSSLFNMPEFREFDKAFRLTSFFDEFDDMFEQLERHMFAQISRVMPEIRVFIGSENPVQNISEETVICAKYPLPGRLSGSLTLIGPTRMDYEKNLSLVKYAVQELNKNYN